MAVEGEGKVSAGGVTRSSCGVAAAFSFSGDASTSGHLSYRNVRVHTQEDTLTRRQRRERKDRAGDVPAALGGSGRAGRPRPDTRRAPALTGGLRVRKNEREAATR